MARSRYMPPGKKKQTTQDPKPTPSPRIGRPPKDIDPDLVGRLAGIGCTNTEIATVVGCDQDTITNRFSEIVAQGRDKARVSLRHSMYRAAVEDKNVKMMIHLAEQKPSVCTLGLGHRPANASEPVTTPLDTNCMFAIPTDDGRTVVFKAGSDIIAQIHGETTATEPPEDGGSSNT